MSKRKKAQKTQRAARQLLKDPDGLQTSGSRAGGHLLQDGKFIRTLKRQDSQVQPISGTTVFTGW